MYKVALVDDDVLVLRFLESMIAWEEHGFEVAGSFKDSVEAYHQIKDHPYDLVITDIGMPKLNGIDLISLLNKEGCDLVKVILSCHDEFHYAQQALKLDVFDYILKEAMDKKSIEELLQRIKVIIDDKRRKSSQSDIIASFLERNKNKLKIEFVERVLEGHQLDDDSWWEEQSQLLGLDFAKGYFTPVLCFIDKRNKALERYKRQTLLFFSIDNILNEIFAKYDKDIQTFYLQHQFFIIFPHKEMSDEMHSFICSVLQEVHRKLKRYLKITITSVIGKGYVTREGLVHSMQELVNNENQRFYYPHDSIQRLKVVPFEKPVIFQDLIEVVENINISILKKDREEVARILEDQLKKLNKLRCEPSLVKDWAVKLVLDIKLRLQALSYFSDSILTGMTDQLVNQVHSLDHLKEVVLEICEKFMLHLECLDNIPTRREIAKVQKYVRMNLHRKITLTEVADYLHLNPSYLSRLFKKTTGEGFVEYVTRIKMEQAKELLMSTNKTVEEIAYDLGFDSKSYFIKTFKKFYGVPPTEIRQVDKELLTIVAFK